MIYNVLSDGLNLVLPQWGTLEKSRVLFVIFARFSYHVLMLYVPIACNEYCFISMI